MTDTNYHLELTALPQTYASALAAELKGFKVALAGASESSVIGVGSGGSFTVASLLCNLHETYTGRVSRPSTPLELICNPTLASSSPIFLISAEGKNPDITEALLRARRHSARTIHVLTNRTDSPLMESIRGLTDVSAHVFELDKKDGYLATNSLLLDAMLVARAYGELDQSRSPFPSQMGQLRIGDQTLPDWENNSRSFAEEAVKRGSMIVVYSPLLKPIALDLESKLSEAALLNCQLCDLRSFAHGRHLWLSQRSDDCVVMAITEPSLGQLWDKMRDLFPPATPTMTMSLGGAAPPDLIAGLVAQMQFVSAVAMASGVDVARPSVPDFSRKLYYLDLTSSIPAPTDMLAAPEVSKFEVMGARWPSARRLGSMTRAREDFQSSLASQRFRAVVFDFDGTLCSSRRTGQALSKEIIEQLQRLLRAEIVIGIASGRGGSILEVLAEVLPAEFLGCIDVGLYNGGWVGAASDTVVAAKETSEFLSHVTRLMRRLKSIGVPIETVKATHPIQVSVRFREGIATEQMWFVLADALRQAGLETASIMRSKHSIDILSSGVSKSGVVAHVIQRHRIDPYHVLTMGDQGAWPGNDASLLEHRYSLSVDSPSRRIDRGWKLAPSHKRDVDATLWYLERMIIGADGTFHIDL